MRHHINLNPRLCWYAFNRSLTNLQMVSRNDGLFPLLEALTREKRKAYGLKGYKFWEVNFKSYPHFYPWRNFVRFLLNDILQPSEPCKKGPFCMGFSGGTVRPVDLASLHELATSHSSGPERWEYENVWSGFRSPHHGALCSFSRFIMRTNDTGPGVQWDPRLEATLKPLVWL